MSAIDDAGLLLDLLREAGDEAVTLDELTVVGVQDPARALLELELAGFAVHRVLERPRPGRSVTCVRLAPASAPAPAPAPPPDPRARSERRLLVAAFALLLLLVLRASRRR